MTKILIDVPDELWKQFKAMIPKSQKLPDAVIEIIKKEIAKAKKSP